jgi:hypothetical protein
MSDVNITEADRAKAEGCVNSWVASDELGACRPRLVDEVASAIATARAEGRAEENEALRKEWNSMRVFEFCNMVNEALSSGGIVDCTGSGPVVRKVLGTLPVTADGCVAGCGAAVYHPDQAHKFALGVQDYDTVDVPLKIGADNFVCESISVDVTECYSTEEAARAAKEASDGK